MVEYTDIKDNSKEIMECIVNCEADEYLVVDEKKLDPDNIADKEEYIDEP